MQKTKLSSIGKKLFGGRTKMEKRIGSKVGSMGTILMFLVSMFAAMPGVIAANGDGVVDIFKPDVASTNDDVTLQITFRNDGPTCLDEIVVTPPSSWGGTASLDIFQKAGNTNWDSTPYDLPDYNYANDNCVALLDDPQSVVIVPDSAICQGETVYIEIGDLTAPSGYEVSDIEILTSDEDHNAGPSCIRAPIAQFPQVTVTHGTKLKIEYFHITDFTSSGFKGRAWGAWARLKELAINADTSGSLKIHMETGSIDTTIFDLSISPGTQWLTMNYSSWDPNDNGANLQDGYLRDQATVRNYYIEYTGNLQLLGSRDEILDDEKLVDSGLAGAKGTIVTAGSSEQRKVLVQLIDASDFDVNEVIPLHLDLDPVMGSVVEGPTFTTDTDGNAFFTFEPACMYGIADFRVYTDPLSDSTYWEITEHIGINSGVPYSYAITEGPNANVPAGESQLIEVEVYDECGNLVTNTDQVTVSFDYLTDDCPDASTMDRLADVPGGTQNDHHQEETDMGIGNSYLITDCNLCTHDVKVTAGGLGMQTINLYGIPNIPYAMQVTADRSEMKADECVEATIEVVDICGNRVVEIPSEVGDHIEEWESIVRVTIETPLQTDQPWPYYSSTSIVDTDFREAEPDYGSYVQGKLNLGVGHVMICGCQGLGTFDIVAKSDTILDGEDSVSVINADPDCIETEIGDEQLLLCEGESDVTVSIKDMCGNYWINQDCLGGEANYCVDLELTGSCMEDPIFDGAHLSTYTVCVPVGAGGPGTTVEPIDLFRDTDDCCQLNVVASEGDGCCEGFDTLLQCEVPSILFHGAPSYMTTQFYKTRKICEPECPLIETECTQQGDVWCWEQLHLDEPLQTEVVSEEVLDLFQVYDECNHIVKDYNGTIDVEKRNEDCASIYQVDHPLVLEEGYCGEDPRCYKFETEEECILEPNCYWIKQQDCSQEFEEETTIKKLVIHNCEEETEKQWLNLEVEDIMVDKLAFFVDHEVDPALGVHVYLESERTPGFQPGEDPLVGKSPLIYGGPTIIEIMDVPFPVGFLASWYSRGWGYDDQREGGVLIRAGDSKDFYVTLVEYGGTGGSGGIIPCGTYSAQFLYYQDYTSADYTEFGCGDPDANGDGIIDAGSCGGNVRDTCINSDNYNWVGPGSMGSGPHCPDSSYPVSGGRKDSRNDDYKFFNGEFAPTPDYGFGDVFIDDLKFMNGTAWTKQRDLTAEVISDWILDVKTSGEECTEEYQDIVLEIRPNPEVITFIPQPATQIELINHDAELMGCMGTYPDKTVCCDEEECDWLTFEDSYLLNLQVTDGFKNAVDKQDIEVTMDYCLKWPFGTNKIEHMVEEFCEHYLDCEKGSCDIEECERLYMESNHCYTKEEFKGLLMKTWFFGDYLGDLMAGDFLGEELEAWIDSYFMNAQVTFWRYDDGLLKWVPLTDNKVITDANGQAQVRVTAATNGLFQIFATPLALDADYVYAEFDASIPWYLDIAAIPAFGVPADGEQEAMLLVRALDQCGNVVFDDIPDVTVTAVGDVHGEDQVKISEDFEGKNNYDNSVTGELDYDFCIGDTALRVLDDIPETATITASAPGLVDDTTTVAFTGAPVQLKITEITPSDRIPADGQTGAWVTIQVQDANGNRVTGYLGDGYSGDPGDPWGCTDYTFNEICIDLDDADANYPNEWGTIPTWFMDIDDATFGWVDLDRYGPSWYCGDLMFGEGKIYVALDNPNCNGLATVQIKVRDDEEYQCQEINENGIPQSVKSTQCLPDTGEIDFVTPASEWDVKANKQVLLANGKDKAQITLQVRNKDMAIRQAVDANVFVGGPPEDGAVLTWNGAVDPHNPTSMRVTTDPVSGRTTLELTSTEPGVAEVTVVGGDAYVCAGMSTEKCVEKCKTYYDWGHSHEYCTETCKGIYQCPGPDCKNPLFWYFDCWYSTMVDLEPDTITVEFIEVADNQLFLDEGWNFISVPFKLNDSDSIGYDELDHVFASVYSDIDQAWGWDANAQNWVALGDSSVLEPLNGYWMYMLNSGTVTLTFDEQPMPIIPTKTVYQGWDTVGLTSSSPMSAENALISIDNSYSLLIDWVEGEQRYELPVANTGENGGGDGQFKTGGFDAEPKQGYWIWVNAVSDELAGLSAYLG